MKGGEAGEEKVIGEIAGADLDSGATKLMEEGGTFVVEGRAEKGDAELIAVSLDGGELVGRQRKGGEHFALGLANAKVACLVVGLRGGFGDEGVRVEGLKFNGVGTGLAGLRNEIEGKIEFAVMVDSDFGDEVARVPLADRALGNGGEFFHQVVQPPSTMRFCPVM